MYVHEEAVAGAEHKELEEAWEGFELKRQGVDGLDAVGVQLIAAEVRHSASSKSGRNFRFDFRLEWLSREQRPFKQLRKWTKAAAV